MRSTVKKKPNEIWVWHERNNLTTVSRFYFLPKLNRNLFERNIKAPLVAALKSSKEDLVPCFTLLSDIDVRGYPHYFSVQWMRDVTATERVNQQFQKTVEVHGDIVLNRALSWQSSVMHTLGNYGQVIETSRRLHVDWQMGQVPLS